MSERNLTAGRDADRVPCPPDRLRQEADHIAALADSGRPVPRIDVRTVPAPVEKPQRTEAPGKKDEGHG